MKNILVIEDEENITAIVKMILEDEGFRVSTLCNADDFRRKVRQCAPDLVLLDLNIGGFDGKIICEYIKTHRTLKHIPVILMSSNFKYS